MEILHGGMEILHGGMEILLPISVLSYPHPHFGEKRMSKTKRRKLTDRQQQVLDFVQLCIAEKYPPTLREIGTHFGFSEKAAQDHLIALERKGYIHRVGGAPRCITIIVEDAATAYPKGNPEFLLELTSDMSIKADGYRVGDFLRLRKQFAGEVGDVVLMDANGILTLYSLTGHVRGILGKVVGHTTFHISRNTPC